MYFSYDIIDKRAFTAPDATALRWHAPDGFIFEMTNAELQHHSDVTAYYLRRMGVGVGSIVFIYELEKVFEFATVVAALNKLGATPVIDLKNRPVERCNELNAYCIIAKNDAMAIKIVNDNLQHFRTLEIKISVGYPYPQNWFDLHTATRLASIFKRPKELPAHYTSLIIYDEKPIYYDETYPLSASSECLWDKFFRAIGNNAVFEF